MLAMRSRLDGASMKIKVTTDLIAESGEEKGSMSVVGGVTIGVSDATRGETLMACAAILTNVAQELASHIGVDVEHMLKASEMIRRHKAQSRETKEVFHYGDKNEA